jgi:hypothetical protein
MELDLGVSEGPGELTYHPRHSRPAARGFGLPKLFRSPVGGGARETPGRLR